MRKAEIYMGLGFACLGVALPVLFPGESWAWVFLGVGILLIVHGARQSDSTEGPLTRFTPTMVEIQAAREQDAKTRKAEAELATIEFENAVTAMMEKIQNGLDALHAQYPGRSIVPEIKADDGDDPRVFAEAKRRIEERLRARNPQLPARWQRGW